MDDKVKELQKEVAHLQKRVDDLLDIKADLTIGLQDEMRKKEKVLESLVDLWNFYGTQNHYPLPPCLLGVPHVKYNLSIVPDENKKLKWWDGRRWFNGVYIKEEDLFLCEDEGAKGEFTFRRDVHEWYYLMTLKSL